MTTGINTLIESPHRLFRGDVRTPKQIEQMWEMKRAAQNQQQETLNTLRIIGELVYLSSTSEELAAGANLDLTALGCTIESLSKNAQILADVEGLYAEKIASSTINDSPMFAQQERNRGDNQGL
ncbi:MAG: hypothetical protein HOE44_08010 [Candidatus Marinimicrobia bacterium]|jgi:hypothetical protein|nr:hypothetical protein [Candidatus Neomarinimicrobiota bacterium]MBT5291033.1 hypothetical protein [Thiotrichales bacterium]MBT7828803.1 hypothetical protein [Candidatus Neomarinimicrobiota bacterium]